MRRSFIQPAPGGATRPRPGNREGAIGFHIVTGFLGAGKTTLINRLVRAPEVADALVIVNEWGAIGLDHLLYRRLEGDAILVAGGCVCCALRGDLVETLRDALTRRDTGALPAFGRIVLETTGLAEPAPILHALFADAVLSTRLTLAGVTTLVDAVNGVATLAARAESARQIALADRLVMAKSDLLPPKERMDRLARVREALRGLNPTAPILDGAAGEFGPAEFLVDGPASFVPRREQAPAGRRPDEVHPASPHAVQSFAFRCAAPIDPDAFATFLSVLGSLIGPRLLRFKGLFRLADRPETPVLVDGVQHVFHAPRTLEKWPDADLSSRAVAIVQGVSAREVESLWAALTLTPLVDAPDLAALADNPLAPRPGGLLG